MTGIFINDGWLDIARQEIDWQWTALRFSDGLPAQYSTDITLPKTDNNVAVLGASGLLDYTSQPLGQRIQPAVLTVGSTVMNIYLQVVAVREGEIDVCLYETRLPEEVLDKNVKDFFVDGWGSIYLWNTNTYPAYPDFRRYMYGMAWSTPYAQYHPVKKLSGILNSIGSQVHCTMPTVDDELYLMATRKTVCPQNDTQVMEINFSDGEYGNITGGQHIVNDLAWSWNPDTKTVLFNRKCNCQMDIWVSYEKKSTVQNNFPFDATLKTPGSPAQTKSVFLQSGSRVSNVETAHWDVANFYIRTNTTLQFRVNEYQKYKILNAVVVLRFSDYEISDDDYGEELTYIGRCPRLLVHDNLLGDEYKYFDASTYTYNFRRNNTTQNYTASFTTPWAGFSYFGYWCNLPDLKLSDLLYELQFITGRRLEKEGNGLLQWGSADNRAEIEGVITEMRPNSDRFGRKNYFKWKNQKDAQPLTEIQNIWLEKEKTLHESVFGYINMKYNSIGWIDQYSNPEHDEESGEYKCDFNEISEPLLWYRDVNATPGSENHYIRRPEMHTMGLEDVTTVMEVTVETYDDVKGLDYFYLDGRKFMIIEGSADVETRKSTVTAVLVPYPSPEGTPGGGGNSDPQDTEPYDPDIADDDDNDNPNVPYEPENFDDQEQDDYGY